MASNTANLMLDEPPLIVKMRGLSGFMNESSGFTQSEQGQLRAGGLVIRVKNAANSHTFRDFDEHRCVFDVEHSLRRGLSNVQREPEDVRIWFSDMDKAGGDEGIYKLSQPELANPMRVEFPCFIADHDDL